MTYRERYGYSAGWALLAEAAWRLEHLPLLGPVRRAGYRMRKAAERRGSASAEPLETVRARGVMEFVGESLPWVGDDVDPSGHAVALKGHGERKQLWVHGVLVATVREVAVASEPIYGPVEGAPPIAFGQTTTTLHVEFCWGGAA